MLFTLFILEGNTFYSPPVCHRRLIFTLLKVYNQDNKPLMPSDWCQEPVLPQLSNHSCAVTGNLAEMKCSWILKTISIFSSALVLCSFLPCPSNQPSVLITKQVNFMPSHFISTGSNLEWLSVFLHCTVHSFSWDSGHGVSSCADAFLLFLIQCEPWLALVLEPWHLILSVFSFFKWC